MPQQLRCIFNIRKEKGWNAERQPSGGSCVCEQAPHRQPASGLTSHWATQELHTPHLSSFRPAAWIKAKASHGVMSEPSLTSEQEEGGLKKTNNVKVLQEEAVPVMCLFTSAELEVRETVWTRRFGLLQWNWFIRLLLVAWRESACQLAFLFIAVGKNVFVIKHIKDTNSLYKNCQRLENLRDSLMPLNSVLFPSEPQDKHL